AQAPAHAPAGQSPAQPEAPGATVTEAPARVDTLGVSHGTPTGNRLRPEDSVASDAQFEAQQAVYRRRKLIDDLVSSGVPAVSATETERRGSGFLALLYLIIPLIAVVLLLGGDTGSSGEEAPAPEGGSASAPSGDVQVVAENLAFDTDTLELAAGEPQTIGFDNQDTEPHNIAVYEDADAGTAQEGALFDGEDLPGGSSVTYEVDPLDSGEYYFQCDIHPSMQGDVIAEGPGGGGSGGGGSDGGAKGGGGGNG
ncbi:MAG: cupredoxin domain-containing protein, partial [Actinomycetota bacterium]|nr:cupredoxin domain-containing protein [Actinomycetota bacterium]